MCNWVRIAKFCELTGYTDKAVRCKLAHDVKTCQFPHNCLEDMP